MFIRLNFCDLPSLFSVILLWDGFHIIMLKMFLLSPWIVQWIASLPSVHLQHCCSDDDNKNTFCYAKLYHKRARGINITNLRNNPDICVLKQNVNM